MVLSVPTAKKERSLPPLLLRPSQPPHAHELSPRDPSLTQYPSGNRRNIPLNIPPAQASTTRGRP